MAAQAFWREREWQRSTVAALRLSLTNLHERLLPLGLGDGAWTEEIMREISKLVPPDCSCAHKRSVATDMYGGGEWMFDLVWIAHAANPRPGEAAFTSGIPLVLECEWLNWSHVWDDFDKLLLARAGLRVMIIQQHGNTPGDWRDVLSDRIKGFVDSDKDDAWLLACWSKQSGFEFHELFGAR